MINVRNFELVGVKYFGSRIKMNTVSSGMRRNRHFPIIVISRHFIIVISCSVMTISCFGFNIFELTDYMSIKSKEVNFAIR